MHTVVSIWIGSDDDDDNDTKELLGGMRGVTVFGSITRAGVIADWSRLLPGIRSDSEMEGCGVPLLDVSVVRMMRANDAAATAINASIWSLVMVACCYCVPLYLSLLILIKNDTKLYFFCFFFLLLCNWGHLKSLVIEGMGIAE